MRWMNSVRRVATPAQRTRTPVASGSRVPVWPRRVPRGNQFWARLTASREVIPEGLSTTSRPLNEVGGMISSREPLSSSARDILAWTEVRAGRSQIMADVCVIYNPRAGRGVAARSIARLKRSLGHRAEFQPTIAPGHAEVLAAQAAARG